MRIIARYYLCISCLGLCFTSIPANASIAPSGDVAPVYNGLDDPWDTGILAVGVTGLGELAVSGGSLVTSGAGLIGINYSSAGTVRIEDATSGWTVNGGVEVGIRGEGNLHVVSGANVISHSGVIGGYAGDFDSRVYVSGAGSSWANFILTCGLRQ